MVINFPEPIESFVLNLSAIVLAHQTLSIDRQNWLVKLEILRQFEPDEVY